MVDESQILKALKLKKRKQLENIVSKNLNMSLEFNYGNGSYQLNGNRPIISLGDTEGNHKIEKSIFLGLPIKYQFIQYDKPIGGDFETRVSLFKGYSECRSNRYYNFKPIGYEGRDVNDWRKGHILFAWLVDRYFKGVPFIPIEKKMMYFTQSKWSNEPIEKAAAQLQNQYYYEKMLQDWLMEESVAFERFRYSVRLIYNETDEVPIATHLQLVTDNDDYYFNVLVPNVNI